MKEYCEICGKMSEVYSRDKDGFPICKPCYQGVRNSVSPPCVYAIRRIDTGKVYVGSTEDLLKRYGSKDKPLLSSIKNPKLHDEIKDFGWEGNFELIVLETFDRNNPNYSKSRRILAESKWLEKYGGQESNQTYNERDAILSDKTAKKVKENKQINIRVSRETHRELGELGKKGQSYDEIVQMLLEFYRQI